MNLKLKEKIRESLSAVLPITGIVLMISIFLIPMELGTIVMFLTGAIMLIVGMGFFQLGAEMSMTPIGEGVGVQISKLKKLITVLLTGLIMGIIITISEPDLQILANQVPSVPNMVLIITVALGVGLFLALALVRIRYKISLSVLLIICYAALILTSFFVPKGQRPCIRMFAFIENLTGSSRSRICAWIVTSSAVVGSSAMRIFGLQASAIAIITLWRIPPDISCG